MATPIEQIVLFKSYGSICWSTYSGTTRSKLFI